MKTKLLLWVAVLFGVATLSAQKPVDLSAKYLKNYSQPYEYLNKVSSQGDTITEQVPTDAIRPVNDAGSDATINVTVGGTSYSFYRFRKVGSPWVTENVTTQTDGGQTGWHIDIQKGKTAPIRGAMTLTVGWDGFATSIDNAKVFQTVTLPAGTYTFNAYYGQDQSGAKYTFLVANAGTSIPDTTNLSSALAYKRISGLSSGSAPVSIQFTLAAQTQVSLGLVASFPEGSQACTSIGDMRLGGFVPGTNYTDIKALVTKALAMVEANYPLGTTSGKYPPEKWNAFVNARTAAKAIVDAENTSDPTAPGFTDTHTQGQVDAAVTALQTAIDDLNNSFIIPFKFSTPGNEYYYRVHDRRSPNRYWTAAEAMLGTEYFTRLIITTAADVDPAADQYKFKFVKNPGGQGFMIYSKLLPEVPLSVAASSANFMHFKPETAGVVWMIKAAVGGFADYFRVYQLTNTAKQMNTYTYEGFVGFWNATGEDPGNDFYFERVYSGAEINMTALKAEFGKVASVTAEKFPIGTGAGQFPQAKWDAFVAAKTTAQNMILSEDTPSAPTSQAAVDAAAANLKTAREQLIASMVPPVTFSTPGNDVYYLVKDKRATSYYWFFSTDEQRLKLKVSTEAEANLADEGLHFKFVRPASDPTGSSFLIYAKQAPERSIFYMSDDPNYLQPGLDAANDTTVWTALKTPAYDAEYFCVALKSTGKQLNSYYSNGGFVGFYTPSTDDPGNDWKFIPALGAGVKQAYASELGVFVTKNRMILCKDEDAVLNVYTVSGQKVNAKSPVAPGVYLVKVAGKTGAAKLIVK